MALYFHVELIKLLPRAFKTRKIYVVYLLVPFKEEEMVIEFSKLSKYENSRPWITGGIAFLCHSSLPPPITPESSKIELKMFVCFFLERSAQLLLYLHYILSLYIYFLWSVKFQRMTLVKFRNYGIYGIMAKE